jgi:flagellar protein FlaJ
VLGGLGTVEPDAYELLFFHAAAIQGVSLGIVAGQRGGRTVSNGVKHAAILLTIAYGVFPFL